MVVWIVEHLQMNHFPDSIVSSKLYGSSGMSRHGMKQWSGFGLTRTSRKKFYRLHLGFYQTLSNGKLFSQILSLDQLPFMFNHLILLPLHISCPARHANDPVFLVFDLTPATSEDVWYMVEAQHGERATRGTHLTSSCNLCKAFWTLRFFWKEQSFIHEKRQMMCWALARL